MSSQVEKMAIRDFVAVKQGKGVVEALGIRGYVRAVLRGPNGKIKQIEEGFNLVTDNGDEEIARRIASDADDIVTGMRLGNDSLTAAAKNGAGANIVTYIATSQEALDAAATFSDKGAGLGFRTTHICTWDAGDITDADIEETVLTSETPITDVAGALANVVARFIFASTIDKQAGDSLEVTWHLDVLGA